MDSIFYNPIVLVFLFLSCFQNPIVSSSSPSNHTLCHVNESVALLNFKKNLTIDKYASSDPFAYNKVASWKLEGESNSDCCSWDGVECENKTGHVIGLELNSSFLFGSINLSSTISSLVHLQRLNLSDNNFNYSHIPSEIGSLSGLTVLDLSQANFSGNIPREISKLSKLVSLRVSEYDGSSSSSRQLKLENLTLNGLVQNLTRLKELDLSAVDISSKLPDILANFSSLETLILKDCNLYGEFPRSIFHMPKLKVLNVGGNTNLSGSLPEFNKTSHLESLWLSSTIFSGKLPESIRNLSSLSVLSFYGCNFNGRVPNLGSLSELEHFSLSDNRVNVDTLIWLCNLTSLTYLGLNGIDLSGSILALHSETNHAALAGLPNFRYLFLESCNLKGFPDFLRYQDELLALDLSYNKIPGRIPMWFSNTSKESLAALYLRQNQLTGFDQQLDFLPWSNIRLVGVNDNMMQGPIPIPPPSIAIYMLSNNSFSGKIPSLLCNLSTLQLLDLSENSLIGMIPPCLSNLSNSLSILNLKGNNLHGPIPDIFKEGSKLKLLDLSQNKLNGTLPRSLEKCKPLRSLDLSNNLFEDVFPFWLGSLPVLQLMLLGSNKLYGDIGNPKSELDFPKLHICDLSSNNFTGHLPGKYFHTWRAMRSPKSEEDKYMKEIIVFDIRGTTWIFEFSYSIAITNKGLKTQYDKIIDIFAAIDFSSNHFEGEIPKVIETLHGLEMLNFSSNELVGEIPLSLGNLSNLESLDISRNKLSGKIPENLGVLNFLEFFNVSFNNLSGLIPRGGQFNTFMNDSYVGNSGLCGDPLSRKCVGEPTSMPPKSKSGEVDKDDDFPSGVDWLVIGLGFGSGLIVGVVIGGRLATRMYKWLVKTF